MKCWNSIFNAEGSRVILVVVQVGAVKIYLVAVEALRKKEREEYETQFTIKIGEKTSLGPSYAFDGLLCWNWLFSASNRLTLQVTLISY
jgi:hypothetical protein